MPLRLTDLSPALARQLGLTAPKRQKFNAVAIVENGERFDSLKERARYGELVYLEKAGHIENLQRQPQYLITKDGIVIAVMTLDFRYTRRGSREWVVEEVKGGRATRTQVYVLRKKLIE